jgi:hypothetical protein
LGLRGWLEKQAARPSFLVVDLAKLTIAAANLRLRRSAATLWVVIIRYMISYFQLRACLSLQAARHQHSL